MKFNISVDFEDDFYDYAGTSIDQYILDEIKSGVKDAVKPEVVKYIKSDKNLKSKLMKAIEKVVDETDFEKHAKSALMKAIGEYFK